MLIQIITGIIGFRSLYFVIPDRHQILKTINKLELGVQIVEFCFYIWISIAVMALSGMTSRRYIDWFITTPTMLLTTVLFFNYNLHLDEENKKGLNETEKTTLTFWDIIKNVKWNYALIFILNAGMLLFGLLGELKIIPLVLSNILGFMCFALLFKELYSFVGDNDENKYIFVYFLIVWGLYGIAQLFSDLNKNISYNFLDVIAKNFYGIFIYYKLSTLAI
jgi:bacteriorhodopsin